MSVETEWSECVEPESCAEQSPLPACGERVRVGDSLCEKVPYLSLSRILSLSVARARLMPIAISPLSSEAIGVTIRS